MIDLELYTYMDLMLKQTPLEHKRYMYSEVLWNARMVGIVGPRGVGKSTMMLQYISENKNLGNMLYVSADSLYFSSHSLLELADDFAKEGGTHLFIDEVHKYKGWSKELKQIYDVHSDMKVTFTGSSVLDIQKGESDLSRRVLMYEMQGLSFREYLLLFHQIESEVYSLEQILNHEVSVPMLKHPLPLFRDYLASGYYPFAMDYGFWQRMEQVVAQTIESDIAQYADLKASTARKLKQMLCVISTLAPYKPNADNLARELSVSKNNVPDYLVYLERAGMIGMLRDDTVGMRALGKIEKVYIDNPSLMTVLAGGHPDVGNIRETFFYNQMRVKNKLFASRQSDFEIEKYTFEIGGKNKGQKQIDNLPCGYIVKDDIEIGHGNIVPLWMFGFNY